MAYIYCFSILIYYYYISGCGRTYTEMTGNISSLNYPLNYVNDLDCQYSIDLSSSGVSSVTLTFLEFETETFFDLVYVCITHTFHVYIVSR